jgi:8-oxo-dGTP diphosphatase
LNPEEHTDYRWISDLNDLDGEKIVPYLVDILKKE